MANLEAERRRDLRRLKQLCQAKRDAATVYDAFREFCRGMYGEEAIRSVEEGGQQAKRAKRRGRKGQAESTIRGIVSESPATRFDIPRLVEASRHRGLEIHPGTVSKILSILVEEGVLKREDTVRSGRRAAEWVKVDSNDGSRQHRPEGVNPPGRRTLIGGVPDR